MSNKQRIIHNQSVQIMWLWVTLGIVILASTFFISTALMQNEYLGRAVSHQHYDDLYQQSARDYCYNHDIKPCTNDSMVQWMKENPDKEQFTFKMRKDIDFADVSSQVNFAF